MKVRSAALRAEIRPNLASSCIASGRCEDTDEVIGNGFLHIEQMDKNCYWARLDMRDGRSIMMWFNSRSPIKLTTEWD